jgi:peroxiredoxin
MRKILLIGLATLILAPALFNCSPKIPQVGDKAPDFILQTTNGNNVSLNSFYGKIILLMFNCIN